MPGLFMHDRARIWIALKRYSHHTPCGLRSKSRKRPPFSTVLNRTHTAN